MLKEYFKDIFPTTFDPQCDGLTKFSENKNDHTKDRLRIRRIVLNYAQICVAKMCGAPTKSPNLAKRFGETKNTIWTIFHTQVRQKSAKLLGGLVHSKFLDSEAQQRLLKNFRARIRSKMTRGKSNKFQKVAKNLDKMQLANFHSGILGLCAFVEAFPYDVPDFVPDILIELEKHLHDPQPIPKTIKNTFQVCWSLT